MYNNSAELYIGKSVRAAEELCDDFYEVAVSAVCEKNRYSVLDGQKYRIYTDENGDTVFITKK